MAPKNTIIFRATSLAPQAWEKYLETSFELLLLRSLQLYRPNIFPRLGNFPKLCSDGTRNDHHFGVVRANRSAARPSKKRFLVKYNFSRGYTREIVSRRSHLPVPKQFLPTACAERSSEWSSAPHNNHRRRWWLPAFPPTGPFVCRPERAVVGARAPRYKLRVVPGDAASSMRHHRLCLLRFVTFEFSRRIRNSTPWRPVQLW